MTGVELRILAYLFSPANAEITMRLSVQFQPIRILFDIDYNDCRKTKLRDFFATNYLAVVDTTKCTACGTCLTRCQMDAIVVQNSKAKVKKSRCIGCGLCATTCSTKAITIMPKPEAERPILPKDRWDLYDQIQSRKKTRWHRIQMLTKTFIKRAIGP